LLKNQEFTFNLDTKNKKTDSKIPEPDQYASARKQDHIALAFTSATDKRSVDTRFNYEPILHGQAEKLDLSHTLAGKTLTYPICVSSMTGGTEKARIINHNLARLCGEQGLAMGLGSCRQLLYEDKRLADFDVKSLMQDQPLFANLGIAQVEELVSSNQTDVIQTLIEKLSADGLIIHVNPLQEWMQPEGDVISQAPIETIKKLLNVATYPIIGKAVGQGFGKESLKALLQLPLEALDLAGYGGTNFSKLELLRSDQLRYDALQAVFNLGHTCEEMIHHVNAVLDQNLSVTCKNIIASGGIKDFLDGYYLMEKCKHPTLYAQASCFLKYALDYEELKKYCQLQIEGLEMAHKLLRVRT